MKQPKCAIVNRNLKKLLKGPLGEYNEQLKWNESTNLCIYISLEHQSLIIIKEVQACDLNQSKILTWINPRF